MLTSASVTSIAEHAVTVWDIVECHHDDSNELWVLT